MHLKAKQRNIRFNASDFNNLINTYQDGKRLGGLLTRLLGSYQGSFYVGSLMEPSRTHPNEGGDARSRGRRAPHARWR